VTFLQGHDESTCPMCKQGIDPAHRDSSVEAAQAKIAKAKEALAVADDLLSKFQAKISLIEETEDQIQKLENEISAIETKQKTLKSYISKIEKLVAENEEKRQSLESDTQNLAKTREEKTEAENDIKSLVEDMEYYDVAGVLLKDNGIKAKIIKHYLPIMNRTINKYLGAMDFFVQFTLDENFTESIKSRYRDEFSYESFSEGEKLRIDLSLLLAWREVAKMKNSVSCNLLILDEVFDSSLDASGMDELMKIIQNMGKANNIFVISHKADQLVEKFQETITFVKKNDFSQMVKT
jgi:DNA repair exonuclease SbcCD ATPase subunit